MAKTRRTAARRFQAMPLLLAMLLHPTTGRADPGKLSDIEDAIKKKGAKWVKFKTVLCKIGTRGAYSLKYKPAKKGAYRLQVTIAKTATHTAATTKWLSFKVK